MAITNLYGAEELLIKFLEPMFPKGMVHTEENVAEINNEFFVEIDNDSDKIACIVLNSGYQADPPVGSGKKQRLKVLWQVVIVCPKSLKANGGMKSLEVLQSLMGHRLSKDYLYMKAVSDERGFNRPDYIVDLVYMPMMFSVEIVV